MKGVSNGGLPIGREVSDKIKAGLPDEWVEWIPPAPQRPKTEPKAEPKSGPPKAEPVGEGGTATNEAPRTMTDEEIRDSREKVFGWNNNGNGSSARSERRPGSGDAGVGETTRPMTEAEIEAARAKINVVPVRNEGRGGDVNRRRGDGEGRVDNGGGRRGGERERGEPLDDVRARFLDRVERHLFFSEGNIQLLTPDDIDRHLQEVGAPEGFRNEAIALVAMLNRSGIKRQFMDHPSMLFGLITGLDLQKQLGDDVTLERMFKNGYQDRYLADLLTPQEAEGQRAVERAWGVFLRIAEGDVPSGGEWAGQYVDAYQKKGFYSLDQENRMVKEVAQRLGISEYQARIGFMMFEAFNEPEANTRHPLYGLTHPERHANTLRQIGLWWGSEGWFRIRAVNRGDRNGMPDRLWLPLAYQELDVGRNRPKVILVDEIRQGRGVSGLLGVMRMRASHEDADVRQKGILEASLMDITLAVKTHKRLTDIGPGTPSSKMDEKMLWDLRESLQALEKKGHVSKDEARRVLLGAAQVYFWEMSMESPGYAKVEDKQLRMMSPVALFEKYLKLMQLQDVDGVMMGVFDFGWGDSGEAAVDQVREALIGHIRFMVNNGERLLPPGQQVRGLVGILSAAMPRRRYLTRKQVGEMWEKSKKRDRIGFGGKREW